MSVKIKPEFLERKIAFGKSAKPLGQRDDLDELALHARKSDNKKLISYFIDLPSLEDLQSKKVSAIIAPFQEVATLPSTAPVVANKEEKK